MLAGSTPPFLGRERAAVDVDVGPERRSPRYHETCLALESVKESSAAVSKPRGVWLRMPIIFFWGGFRVVLLEYILVVPTTVHPRDDPVCHCLSHEN